MKRLDCAAHSIIGLLLVGIPLVYYPYIEDFSNLPKKFVLQILLGLSGLLYILHMWGKQRLQLIRHPLCLWVAFWLIWSGLSICWAIDRFSGVSLWIHWLACSVIMMVFLIQPSEIWVERWIQLSSIGAGIASLIGCIQYLFGFQGIPQSFVPGVTFSNKNIAAEYVVMLWPLSFAVLFHLRKRFWIIAATFNMSLITLFLVYAKTRSVWVAMVLGGVFGSVLLFRTLNWEKFRPLLLERRYSILIAILFVMLVAQIAPHSKDKQSQKEDFPLTSRNKTSLSIHNEQIPGFSDGGIVSASSDGKSSADRIHIPAIEKSYWELITSIWKFSEGSANFRLIAWENTLAMMADHAIGVGLANWYVYYPIYQQKVGIDPFFSLARQPQYLHHEWLQAIAETSILGGILYLGILLTAFQTGIRICKSRIEITAKINVLCVCVTLASFAIHACFAFPMRMALPPFFLMFFMGILIYYDYEKQKQRDFAVHRWLTVLMSMFVALLIYQNTTSNIHQVLADRYVLISKYYKETQNWVGMKAFTEKAVQINPWLYKAWYELGIACKHIPGMDEKAIAAFEKALSIHPNHLNTLLNISRLLYLKGRLEDAAGYLLRSLDIQPNLRDAYFNLAMIREKQNRYQDAIAIYERMLNNVSDQEDVYLRLVNALLKDAQIEKAKEILLRMLQKYPENAKARALIRHLQSNLHSSLLQRREGLIAYSFFPAHPSS
uniref:Tetratricopeptide repeat protein n=1 Tax=Desulfatirhabdium butyrativorans TaxID=340467 RepID=A0A7C4VZ65_9BACT